MNQVFNTSLKTKFDTQETLIDNAIGRLPKDVAGIDGANSGIVPKLVDQYRIKYTLPTIIVDLAEKRVENGIDDRAKVIYYLGYMGDGEYFKFKPEKELNLSLGHEILYTDKNIEITVQTHGAAVDKIDPYIMINIDSGIEITVRQIHNVLNQIATEINSFNNSLKDLIYEKIKNRI